MAKFVIECPSCGRFAEAKTGFFARKKIDCTCGFTINVRTDKLTSRTCPHCKNEVVFDQSKGAAAKCPVCGEPINTMTEQSKAVEFSCQQCGIRLNTSKGVSSYVCPVCDHVNDVAERLKVEQIKHDGLASIIKYEGDNETLVWKHPVEDFNMGSQLIVHESQEAIFFRDGQALDLFGAGRYTLETQQLPILEKFYKLPTDTEGTFHSEVYYINMTTQMIKSNSPITYFTVYIDGQRVDDPNRLSTGSNTSLFAVSPGNNTLKVASFKELGTHTIKILKQTESNYNICEMKAIQFTGLLSEPPADKELYIEFIGDSLTCGMGNIGINGCSDPQSAFWEDGTQSYGYMVAEQLNADYSIISQSGIGIAGGWSNYPMETYYTAQSYTRNKNVKQEFKRIPDVIVINLGTNDYFINHDKSPNECKPEDVERMTEELILLVRKCYGADVPIIWAQGMVGTFVLDRIQAAIDKVGGADAGIYTYYTLPKNTGGAQGHPTVAGHVAAATAILPEIKKVLGIN